MTSSPAPGPVAAAAPDGAATRRADLTAAERAEMFALLAEHFEGVSPAGFARDLDAKDWVLRFRAAGRLAGFSTLQVFRATHAGRRLSVIYSGDTIMAREAWSSPVLARTWIRLVRRIQAGGPPGPWYWLLLSSGFRTYRFLPVFFRRFWPRHDAPPAPGAAALLGALARARFGAWFDEAAGVVRFPHPQRLRGTLAAVPEGRHDDPHVRFFLARNPGHAAGDELVCLTELSDANYTPAAARMIRAPRPGGAGPA